MRAGNAKRAAPDWAQVIVDAVKTPGILSSAYSRFWNYSVGNQLLAIFECMSRGLQPGPIHTFNGWLELGRHVKKGERAITLCMPVLVKKKSTEKPATPAGHAANVSGRQDAGPDDTEAEQRTVFVYKARWFVLSQTEGKDYVATEVPEWSESRTLEGLKIQRIDFIHPNGNCQGFAQIRQVAVSPIAVFPHKTLFHELAHVVIGHTMEGVLDDHDLTPRSLREVEAECVALICCESLGLPGAAESRGYIQHWLSGQTIPDRSAQKIFKAADAILKAGRPVVHPTPDT